MELEPGTIVLYLAHPKATPERGVVVSIAQDSAFVRFDGDLHAKSVKLKDIKGY